MSTASKVTLLASLVATSGIVIYVHTTQVNDREKLRQVRTYVLCTSFLKHNNSTVHTVRRDCTAYFKPVSFPSCSELSESLVMQPQYSTVHYSTAVSIVVYTLHSHLSAYSSPYVCTVYEM